MSNLASAALALQKNQTITTPPTPAQTQTVSANLTKWEIRNQQYKKLGQAFNQARRNQYKSQYEVARLAQVSKRTVSRVERDGIAKVTTLVDIANALGYEVTLAPINNQV
jgi:DNA-binding XRE family transcriptional regulator